MMAEVDDVPVEPGGVDCTVSHTLMVEMQSIVEVLVSNLPMKCHMYIWSLVPVWIRMCLTPWKFLFEICSMALDNVGLQICADLLPEKRRFMLTISIGLDWVRMASSSVTLRSAVLRD
ncbi:hypothetical protein SKAU_G00077620 [Synaphobranchus kaupii]|uniref:Uncharacterized protein n=1 Tax=Synaphobranchus kaupii TaxID=118154 RepID=A0A9Q1G800_SYNKA|nr:hypothetical protein SKAU_G00077620 [Synaphobranchus kaupii]